MLRNPTIRDRDYRRLFAGAAFHQQGMSGEQVVIGLMVYEATGTTAWVGTVLAIYFVPFFVFGLLSGAVADWIDRRTLLRRIELATAAVIFVYAGVAAGGEAPLWLIAAFSLSAGSLRALHQPVRSSYADDLVGEENLVSAMGLLNIGSRSGQLLGALVAIKDAVFVGEKTAFWGDGCSRTENPRRPIRTKAFTYKSAIK